MCHYRDKIERCVKDILWDQTFAKQRVFTVSEAVYNQNFPMIILFSPKETVETPPAPERPYRRLNLDIVGIVRGQKDLATTAHLFARQIEEAIAMDTEVFPSFVQQVSLLQSEVEVQSNEQQPPSLGGELGGNLADANPHAPVAHAGTRAMPSSQECLLAYVKIGYAIHYRAGTTSFAINNPELIDDPVPTI